MHVYYSDPFEFPLPAGHRFPLAKYRLLRERIERWPASSGVELMLAPRALRDELLLVHTAAYVDDFVAGRLSQDHQRRIGLPWSPELVERSLRSCGGTLAATRQALVDGATAYLAGGTHHARADRGAGYCVFNDLAVGARIVQRESDRQRILIVDTDVHQGDGTAAIFAGDPSVFTFSIHGAQNFPAAKASSDLDVELPPDCGDEAYLQALAVGLQQAFHRSEPQFVYYLSGADACVGDRLGTLRIGKQALATRDAMVFAACRERRLPVVTVMGGGYGKNLDDTVDVYEASVRAALQYHQLNAR
jgi:acetoin utilization deacetylase AcuC-like enzyme